MRALKKGKYGTVEYVSDNYTVRNKDLISKHVFAGNTRLVSKTVMQEEQSGKTVAVEQGAYYYHPDHLGSSNVVTDKDGKFYEQIEYFPYGETWIQNKANAEQTSSPYKFTAKEYDEETGLYYYGARYYDAMLSRWVSSDDRFDDLYSSQGQDIFAYVHNKPMRYNDPTGNYSEDSKYQNYGFGLDHRVPKEQTNTNKNKLKDKPDATIKITSVIEKNSSGEYNGKTCYGMSGKQKVEYTENDITVTFTVPVRWWETDEQEGSLNYEFPTPDGSGTIQYNPKSETGKFHLRAAGHPEPGVFIHYGYISEGCGMLGYKPDYPGEDLYWHMVDMVKNGKRIDYEFKRIDLRKPEEINSRPIPKGE